MKYPVIDDNTDVKLLLEHARGLNLRGRPRGFAYGKVATPFNDSLLIPQEEWLDWLADAERTKSTPMDLIKDAGLKVKNQETTNYCWVNSPVYCMELHRIKQGQRHVELSPASAAARIKKFRNVGGWGRDALEWLSENGCSPIEFWPANAIEKRYDTAENRELCKDFVFDKWIELEPRNLEQVFSCLLRRIPVSVGLNFWGHQISYIWVNYDKKLKEFQPIFANSWGEGWGTDGYGVLAGNKRYPDDCCAPISVMPS